MTNNMLSLSKELQISKSIGNLPYVLMSLILFILILPFVSVLFLALYLLKMSVKIIVCILYGNHEQLTFLETVFFTRLGSRIGYYAVLQCYDGDTDIETLRGLFHTKVMLAKNAKGEKFAKHFKYYPCNYFGYFVWKKESHFSLSDHVLEYTKQASYSEEQLNVIVEQLFNEPLSPKQSPWLLHLIRMQGNDHDVTNKFALLFICHHCVGDGMASLQLLESYMNDHGKDKKRTRIVQDKREKVQSSHYVGKIYHFIRGIITLPSDVLKQCSIKDTNILHGPRLSGEWIYRFSKPINLETIKHIKNATRTSFNAVLVSCLSGVFRKYFLRRELPLPNSFHASIPIIFRPRNEFDCFANDFAAVFVDLKIQEMSLTKRTFLIHQSFSQMKTSFIAHFNYFFRLLLNLYPLWIIKETIDSPKASLGISFVPSFVNKITVCHERDLLFLSACSPLCGRQGVGITFLTYNGKGRLGFTVDRTLIDDEQVVEQFLIDFEEELTNLKEEVNNEAKCFLRII